MRVLAIDRDPAAIAAGRALAGASDGRLTLVEGRFGDLDRIAEDDGFAPADGVVLDIGVSSMQLDEPERGFSFQGDGPLDMRMSASGPDRRRCRQHGGGLRPRRHPVSPGRGAQLARASPAPSCAARASGRSSAPPSWPTLAERVLGREKIAGRHAATRTFQALRIYVNDELGELAQGLAAAERVLKPGGRLAVVTFHSLEDGIVKRFLKAAGRCANARARAICRRAPRPSRAELPTDRHPRPIVPTQAEIDANPRARSAKLRAAIRTDAPAWPDDDRSGVSAALSRRPRS